PTPLDLATLNERGEQIRQALASLSEKERQVIAVDGVQFTAKGPVLVVDGKNLSLKDVRKIEVAKPKQELSQKNIVNPNSKMSEGAIAKNPMANLENVQMDKELRQKLETKLK
ncbi:MAG: hypothetical protein AAF203_01075, partial [Pseudomonadota bacterium]